MGEVYIGTSGYDYAEWRGVFYPEALPRGEFLAFYAQSFNALELNFSYYAIPTAKRLADMAARTAGRVRFSVKGNRRFTHEIKAGEWKDAVREYRSSLYPLENDGLLLSVLLQFPQSFHYEPSNRRYLANLLDELGDTPLVVEFRHIGWFNPRVYDELERRNVGICLCDMPEISRLPSFVRLDAPNLVTGGGGYLRFHGRNGEQWYESRNSRDRYEYLYDDDELKPYLPVIQDMAGKAKLVQVYFNNHAKGVAAVNDRKLKSLSGK